MANGYVSKKAAAPNKAALAQRSMPKPQASAQASPARYPEPVEVAIVFKTFGPGTKTLSKKKPNAGSRSKKGIIS